MSSTRGQILVIDDEAEIRDSLEALLGSEGFSVASVGDAEEGVRRLDAQVFDLVLLDVNLPGRNGLELMQELHRKEPSLPVMLITAYGSIDMARAGFKAGARDYITKPWDNSELLALVYQAIEQKRLREENVQLKRAFKHEYRFDNIVGKSEAMLKIFDLIRQIAPSRATVLIQGESGTGKELIAKAIHANSPRADQTFVPVNTGSMPVDLLESTLFGHVKGAFTSAVASKKGLFEVADHGSIFFDEISTVGLETQAKLLRVIQEREFMHLGGTETIKVDVRILAATNVDLRTLVAENGFREDLFYRLNVITIQLPPLRERKEDIPLLVEHFIHKYCEENAKPIVHFTPQAMKLLMDYAWPGNVRELENLVERAVVLAAGQEVGVELLPEQLSQNGFSGARLFNLVREKPNPSLTEILEECERQIIQDMLERTNWSQTAAAERFQVPLSTLNQKIKRLGINARRSEPRSNRGERRPRES